MIPFYQEMVDRVCQYATADERIMGLALSGSYARGQMDEYSDLDFVLVIASEYYTQVFEERFDIITKFGHLLTAFTGEHVGEPRLVISLYDHPLMHCDFTFISLTDATARGENPAILYQVDDCLTKAFSKSPPTHLPADPQWIEQRFWVWIHYVSTKIGRGRFLMLSIF